MSEKQLESQKIEKEIDMLTFIIYWKMRNWKTVLWIRIALDYYPRIYSNVNIYHEWKSIVNLIEDYTKLDNIRFSYTPWVIVIDEAWLNANSKDTRSEDNRILQKVLFLWWKKNCSIIWIAQRFESIDINARVLADYIINVKKFSRGKKHPLFYVTKERQKWWKLLYVQRYRTDTIAEFKEIWVSYNTLEESKMKTKKQKKEEETENELTL